MQTPILRNLSTVDQHAICRTLHLPYPTAERSLEIILAQEKISPADVLVRLERSRDLRAMIAAAALRGRVQTCPADPRLSPKPYPKAPVKAPRDSTETTRIAPKPKAATAPNPARTLASVVPNPKRPGSAARDRYALYQLGLTEAQLLERGLWRSDFRHDTQHGYITWS